MIIELFGLPASGKTTIARKIVERIEASGIDARLLSAHEPVPMGRLFRRGSKLMNVLWASTIAHGAAAEARELVALFPQRGRLRAIRLCQYLTHLRKLLASSAERREVLVFDQGALQAVFSLAALSTSCKQESLSAAVEWMPRPDLLVALNTLPPIVAERLRTSKSHGQVADVIAVDAAAMSNSAQISARIRRLAEARGWRAVVGNPSEMLVDEVVSITASRQARITAAPLPRRPHEAVTMTRV